MFLRMVMKVQVSPQTTVTLSSSPSHLCMYQRLYTITTCSHAGLQGLIRKIEKTPSRSPSNCPLPSVVKIHLYINVTLPILHTSNNSCPPPLLVTTPTTPKQYYLLLRLRIWYEQIPLAGETKDVTPFMDPGELYCSMPIGTKGVKASFDTMSHGLLPIIDTIIVLVLMTY